MEIKLDNKTIDRIASAVVAKLKNINDDEMVSTREAARLLGISTSRVRRLAQTGKLPCVKQGEHSQGRLMFPKKTLYSSYFGIVID